MICRNCGANVEANGGFCPRCGAQLAYTQPTAPVNTQQQYGAPVYNAPVYGAPAPADDASNGRICGIMGIVVIVLGLLSLFNPTGGGVGFLLKYLEGEGANFFMKALFVPVIYLQAGVDGEAGAAGVFAGLFGFLGGFILMIAFILLIIYSVKALSGKTKPVLGMVALIMCIVVAVMFISAPIMMNNKMEELATKVGNVGDVEDSDDLQIIGNIAVSSQFVNEWGSGVEIDEDKMAKDLKIDDVEDMDDVEESLDKMGKKFKNIVSPTAWDWLFLISAIAGIVVLKMTSKRI